MTELLPCPFCGNAKPILQEHPPHKHFIAKWPDHPGSWTIECVGCAAMIADTKDAVVSAWNRRAQQPGSELVPVAWRVKRGAANIWGYTETEADADFHGGYGGMRYVKEPLYPAAALRGVEAVTQAARVLVDKLEAIHADPAYQSVWTMNQIHAGPYKGPNYAEELAALKAAIERKGD